jgi:hypothetical protein
MGSIAMSYRTGNSGLYAMKNTVPQQNMHTCSSLMGVCSRHITVFNWSQEMNQNKRSFDSVDLSWRPA